MTERQAADGTGGHFLGEFRTRITGAHLVGREVSTGDEVRLCREPDNPQDDHTIQVVDASGQVLGRLSRRVAEWLAPLLDGETVRIEAVVSAPPGCDDRGRRRGPELALLVFLTERGRTILEDRTLVDERDIAHAMVLWAWRQAHDSLSPGVLKAVFARVRRALPKRLHPESHLLLAIELSLIEEAVRTQAFRAAAETLRPVRRRNR